MALTFTAEARKNVWRLLAGEGGSSITVRLYVNNVPLDDTTTLAMLVEANAVPGYRPQTSGAWSAPALASNGDGQIVSPGFVFTRGVGSPAAQVYGYYLTIDLPRDGTQTLTVDGVNPFTLSVGGNATDPLAAAADAPTIQAALQALANLPGLGNLTVTPAAPNVFTLAVPAVLAAYGAVTGAGTGLLNVTPYTPAGPPTRLLLGLEPFLDDHGAAAPYPYTLPADQVPVRIQLDDRNLTS